MHDAFHTPNLSREITVMIINTGQMCTVSYLDKPSILKMSQLETNMTYYKKETIRKKYDILRDNLIVSYSN